jgi:FkbM family methyltransferase
MPVQIDSARSVGSSIDDYSVSVFKLLRYGHLGIDMFCLREKSLNTDDPLCTKIPKDCLFFPRDYQVARDWALNGNYEYPIIDWAVTLIDPSKIFVDIGAHVGTYSLAFAKKCAGVQSFECFPRTFNFLCANIALQDFDNKITPHRTALGNRTGEVTYTVRAPLDGGGNSCLDLKNPAYDKFTLPITTLDSFKLSNIGLIKIDVEGFEKDVLEGAVETLARNGKPKILFESWRPERDSEGLPASRLREELFDYVRSIGYTIHTVSGWDEMYLAD